MQLLDSLELDVRRKLTQAAASTCAWDDETEECFPSAGTVLDLLDEVDNSLSNYLSLSIVSKSFRLFFGLQKPFSRHVRLLLERQTAKPWTALGE